MPICLAPGVWGWGTAAIKFHNSVDTVISDSLIRGVYRRVQGAFGIWVDFGNQGFHVTRNIVYNTKAATLFLGMNHGPRPVDNNVTIHKREKLKCRTTTAAWPAVVVRSTWRRLDLQVSER